MKRGGEAYRDLMDRIDADQEKHKAMIASLHDYRVQLRREFVKRGTANFTNQ